MKTMPKKFTIHILLICLALQACVPSLPQNQQSSKQEIISAENFPDYGQKAVGENILKQNWKMFYEDKQLAELIEIALKNNQELNILDQEINIANNQIIARKGAYLPRIGLGAGIEREKTSAFSYRGVDDDAAGLPDKLTNRQVGLNASWEIDIWKKLRNSAKSAYLEYLATKEGKNFAVTQLVAEIANDYYELMALDNELEIIREYIGTIKQAKEMAHYQQIAARATSLAVKRFAAELLKNQSREYEISQKIIEVENHLNRLLGRLPRLIERPYKHFTEIKLKEVATAVPTDLLENRPDLKQAALKVEATKLNVKAVKAQFYPALTVDGNLGYMAFNSKHLLDSPEAVFYNIAGNISAPLINRTAIKADYFSANNEQIKSIYDYELTFIKAYVEVANQLSWVNNLKTIYDLKSKQTKILEESFDISNTLFRAARIDYLEALLTRRDYLEARLQLIEVKQQQLSAYVNLYRALGGGWRDQ